MAEYKFDEIAFNSTAKKKPTATDSETYLGLEHLDSGNLTVTRIGSDVAPIGEKLIMEKGDILFGKRRAYQKKVAIAPFDGIFSAHGMVLRPKEGVVASKFFPLFISSDYFLDAAIKISVGSLSPTINWRDLKELKFDLPSLDEQKRLSEILWAMLEAKYAYKHLLSLTDQLVKSQFVEMFGDPATNPMGWEKRPLGKTCIITTGNTPPRANPEYYGDYIEWIKTDNIQVTDSTLAPALERLSEQGFERCRYVEANSILMTCIAGSLNSIGNAAITDRRVAFNQQINALTPKEYDCVFLCWLLKMMKGEICSAVNMMLKGILSKGNLSEIAAILPSLPLQIRFADFVAQADKSKFVLARVLSRKHICGVDAVTI
jgi:type I restriction enzyme S subunit